MLHLSDFINNTQFNRQLLLDELPKIFKNELSKPVFEVIKLLYNKEKFEQLNEAQIEEEFIKPVLQALGYAFAYQVSKKAFGKSHKPDFALFANTTLKDEHYSKEKDENTNILALCESKAYHVELDNKRIEENPHFQLIRYLNDLKIDYGFLTNGRFWRFYDTKVNRANKIFYEIDLEQVILNNDLEAFNYFYFVFRKDNFVQKETTSTTQTSGIQDIIAQNEEIKAGVERDLREVIYGADSLVEQIGQALYNNKEIDDELDDDEIKPAPTLAEIYQNSVTFAFRMLFIAYFEDKFEDELFKIHKIYKKYSLRQIINNLNNTTEYEIDEFNGWGDLKYLFEILDEGRKDYRIPLLNGGLFAEDKAQLLTRSNVINNKDLAYLLKNLLGIKKAAPISPKVEEQKPSLFTNERQTKNLPFSKDGLVTRDFKTLSITHIGNIYEGLLEFDFKRVPENQKTHYVIYQNKGKEIDGQLDDFDYNALKNNKSVTILHSKTYQQNEIYFSQSSNSRKTTASYYTPTSFTEFMATSALKEAISNEPQVLKLRILDNACGSGHFLIEILNQITEISYQNLHNQDNTKENNQQNDFLTISTENLKETLETEKNTILQKLKTYIKGEIKIDELVLLKRILLKKIIFGVDLNAFAVELTRLSLWLDTFIFGTPLSFIEHHVKQGNALIGAKFGEVMHQFLDVETQQVNLIGEQVKIQLQDTIKQLKQLSDLKDTTQEDILKSKQIYKNLQKPLITLNRVLNLHTYQQFVPFEYPEKEQINERLAVNISIKKAFDNLQSDILEEKNTIIINEIDKISKKYLFFNYEIEFAEVFQGNLDNEANNKGFHIIIGNPPWDKTKFDDKDFFSQYRSSYRTMKQSEKEEVRQNILEYTNVRQEYENEKDSREKNNEYYKATYPYNAGTGDGNLFRFFIERNLALLHPKGAITYLTPSSWIYEDGSTKLRKHILQEYQLNFFFQFENKKAIFERVHRSYKFATFQVTQKNNISHLTPKGGIKNDTSIPVRFMETDITVLKVPFGDLGAAENILEYPIADISLLSPEYLSFMEVKTNRDLEILRMIYAKFAPISTDYIDFRNELHATFDRNLFLETNDVGLLPLYEGKMIYQYNSKYTDPQYFVNQKALENRLESVEISRLVDDIFEQIDEDFKATLKNKGKQYTVLTYLEMENESELVPFLVFDTSFARLMFRGISSNTNERTMISALLPTNYTYQHSMFGHSPKNYVLEGKKVVVKKVPLERVLFVNAVLNSLVNDYVARFIVDINVSKTYLMRLPFPQPTDLELKENVKYQKIIKNAFLLNWRNNKSGFASEAQELNILETELPKTDKHYIKMCLENDMLVTELYGISKEELAHITGEAYFKVLHNNNQAYLDNLLS